MRYFSILLVATLITIHSIVMASEKASTSWQVMGQREESHSSLHQLRASSGNTFVKRAKASASKEITLTFVVKQRNIEDIALSIANPKSPNYGKHLSREQVTALTENREGEAAVRAYLAEQGITDIQTKGFGSYIAAKASVDVWEKALNTEFFDFRNTLTGQELIRTDRYSLPSELAPHVMTVMDAMEFPVPVHGGPVITPLDPSRIREVPISTGPVINPIPLVSGQKIPLQSGQDIPIYGGPVIEPIDPAAKDANVPERVANAPVFGPGPVIISPSKVDKEQ